MDAAGLYMIQERAEGVFQVLLGYRKGRTAKAWGAPGGLIEKQDKNRKETALREFKEETGLSSRVLRKHQAEWIPLAHKKNFIFFTFKVYFAFLGKPLLIPIPGSLEIQKFRWFATSSLPSTLLPGTKEAIKLLNEFLESNKTSKVVSES